MSMTSWEFVASIFPLSVEKNDVTVLKKMLEENNMRYRSTHFGSTFVEVSVEAKYLILARKEAEKRLRGFCGILTTITKRNYDHFILGEVSKLEKVEKEWGLTKTYTITFPSPKLHRLSRKDMKQIKNISMFVVKGSKGERVDRCMDFIDVGAHASSPEHAFLSYWNALNYLLGGIGRKDNTMANACSAFWLLRESGVINKNIRAKWDKNFEEFYNWRTKIFFGGKSVPKETVENLLKFFEGVLAGYLQYFNMNC